jgi:single-strand DNA-binding protein
MLNRIVLIGRLTRDPELKYTPNGIAVCTFTLAVARAYKNSRGEREVDFIPCVTYRQLAEIVANHLSKGKLAAVDGKLQVRSFAGKDDGKKVYISEVIADDVRFLSPRDNNANTNQYGTEVDLDDEVPL